MSTRPVFRLLPADVKHGAYTGRARVEVVRVFKWQSAGIQEQSIQRGQLEAPVRGVWSCAGDRYL